jgi:uncharacterized membrane protein YsdA (DUF1294 family)
MTGLFDQFNLFYFLLYFIFKNYLLFTFYFTDGTAATRLESAVQENVLLFAGRAGLLRVYCTTGLHFM